MIYMIGKDHVWCSRMILFSQNLIKVKESQRYPSGQYLSHLLPDQQNIFISIITCNKFLQILGF